jgi:hypothetical protein
MVSSKPVIGSPMHKGTSYSGVIKSAPTNSNSLSKHSVPKSTNIDLIREQNGLLMNSRVLNHVQEGENNNETQVLMVIIK